jgi:thymidylate kinase
MISQLFRVQIDGLDLAGKTSTIRLLKSQLDGETRVNHISYLGTRKSNPKLKEAEILHEGSGTSKDKIKGFFEALSYESGVYNHPECNVIQDSSILMRTMAHQGSNSYAEELFSTIVPNLPKFDRFVILTANLDSRIQRLEKRKQESTQEITVDDSLILTNPDLFFSKENQLIKYSKLWFDPLILDTSNQTIEEITDTILQTLM